MPPEHPIIAWARENDISARSVSTIHQYLLQQYFGWSLQQVLNARQQHSLEFKDRTCVTTALNKAIETFAPSSPTDSFVDHLRSYLASVIDPSVPPPTLAPAQLPFVSRSTRIKSWAAGRGIAGKDFDEICANVVQAHIPWAIAYAKSKTSDHKMYLGLKKIINQAMWEAIKTFTPESPDANFRTHAEPLVKNAIDDAALHDSL